VNTKCEILSASEVPGHFKAHCRLLILITVAYWVEIC